MVVFDDTKLKDKEKLIPPAIIKLSNIKTVTPSLIPHISLSQSKPRLLRSSS